MDITSEELRAHVLADPDWFVRRCLGVEPWEKEVEIMKSVRDHMKTLVAGCVSSGKTHATACLMFWWLAAFFPARVFCLAPTERQLKINLWGEVPRIFRNAPVDLGGSMMPLSLQYRISEDWFAMGFSPQDAHGVFGIHGPHDLLVIDDAQGVKQEIWAALENALAGGATHVLASCNPIVTSGEIYDAMTKRRGEYNVITIPAQETPNLKEGRVVIPGMITQEMVGKWIEKYGIDSDFVRTKVFAKLPKQEPDTLIPLDWIEGAINRDLPTQPGMTTVLGVDVARFGDDNTVLFPIKGRQGITPQVVHGNDTMQVCGHVVRAINELNVIGVYIDVIGIGSGVYDRLVEIQREGQIPSTVAIVSINVGEKPTDDVKYSRLRDELWWTARESLNPLNPLAVALPKNNELMAELAAPKWSVDSAGRIKVESKDDMKERLGRSPDLGDAYCFRAGTLIRTPLGNKQIEKIRLGEMVSTPMGDRRVVMNWESNATKLTTVKFSNGSTLTGKPEHKIFTFDSGWVRLDALVMTNHIESDSLIRRMIWKMTAKWFTKAKHSGFKNQVDILALGGRILRRDFFTGGFIQNTTDQLRKVIRSIIEMGTGGITTYPTLNWSTPNYTPKSIWRKEWISRNMESSSSGNWKKHELRPRNGTQPKKDCDGILSMGKTLGSLEINSQKNARFATKVLKHSGKIRRFIARALAGYARPIIATRALINALRAAINLLTINIRLRPIVPVNVRHETVGNPVKVYNLTLESDNVYYANGILVSNCLAVYGKMLKSVKPVSYMFSNGLSVGVANADWM